MKTLLISVQQDLDTIGLKYLHYYLQKQGHHSTILYLPSYGSDRNSKKHQKEIEEFVRTLDPGLVGVSLLSIDYFGACLISSFLKKVMPSVPIVWGGIHPTMSPRECLDYADYVCIGEGEKTLLGMADAIASKKNIEDINNLCYLKNGSMQRNSLNPLLEDLDNIPFYEHIPTNSYILNKDAVCRLDRDLFKKYARYGGKTYSIMATRGCPFSCTYCHNNLLVRLYKTRKIRRRSIEHVIKELEQAVRQNPKIEYINFQDDCFLASPTEYFEKFCDAYKKRIKTPFIIRTLPVYVTRAKLVLLKESGLSWINLGLQSGSDRVCREVYKRRSSSADFLKAANVLKELGIAGFYDVITDSPFDTEEDNLKTIDVLMKTPKPFFVEYYSLTLYPGTELYEKAQAECPDSIRDNLKKDYLITQKSTINNLIRLAAYAKTDWARKAVELYKKGPTLKFRFIASILYFLNVTVFEPVIYFRVIKLSQKGSLLRTFKVLLMYLKKEAVVRYTAQFKGET